MTKTTEKKRCHWVPAGHKLYERYHDEEWGRSVRDDRVFFEFLVLESAQAGLSWETILKRREGYRQAFAGFNPKQVARFNVKEVTRLMKDEGIIRHRLKITSTISNAQTFLALQKEFGSFSNYVWKLVGKKIKRSPKRRTRPTSPSAEALSADLKRRGVKFFGPVIAYAFMQATGLVDDHETQCFRYRKK